MALPELITKPDSVRLKKLWHESWVSELQWRTLLIRKQWQGSKKLGACCFPRAKQFRPLCRRSLCHVWCESSPMRHQSDHHMLEAMPTCQFGGTATLEDALLGILFRLALGSEGHNLLDVWGRVTWASLSPAAKRITVTTQKRYHRDWSPCIIAGHQFGYALNMDFGRLFKQECFLRIWPCCQISVGVQRTAKKLLKRKDLLAECQCAGAT